MSGVLRRTKIALTTGITAIMVIIISTFAISSISQNFIFSKSLNVEEFKCSLNNAPYDYRNEYVANLTDENTVIRTVFLRIMSSDPNSTNAGKHWVLFSLSDPVGSHGGVTTEVDAISFRFDFGFSFVDFYVQPLTMNQSILFSQDGHAIIYEIKELGSLGTGTLNFDFLIEDISQLSHVVITADISMHQTTIMQLTSLNAHVFLDAQIP